MAGHVAWDFSQSSAVVTGASSGIGLETAQSLMRSGAAVYGVGRKHACPAFDAVAAEATRGSRYFAADIAQYAALEGVRDAIAGQSATAGSLNLLVVNAGVGLRKEFLDCNQEELRGIVDVNLLGAMWTLHVFGPMLASSGSGAVVITSSIVEHHGMRLRAAYGATKGGLAALVRALAVEWGPLGIRVNAVAPGLVETPLVEAYALEHPERRSAMESATPVGKLARPKDVAQAIAYLLSDASSHVNGAVLPIDGGFSVGSSVW